MSKYDLPNSPDSDEPTPDPTEPEHIATGILRLDYILEGGLPAGHLHLIYGPSGSGKTVAANQMCFYQGTEFGRRSVYMTVAAESHAKIIEGVSGLDFFDPACVGEQLKYVSGYSTLRDDGLDGLLGLIRRAVLNHEADLLVLDGIQTVRDHSDSMREYRAWLHLLQSVLSMAGATGVLLASTSTSIEQESTVADGLIEFSSKLIGPRFVRELVVYKLRGSGYLSGRHQFEISDIGLTVHPRTEVQFAEPAANAKEERERMRFGSDNLDQMLHGGVLSGSATALLGARGSGKTTLGLSFLAEGAKHGQPGVYFGFSEPPPRLIAHAEEVGIELARHVDSGLIKMLWQPPLEHFVDGLAEQLLGQFRAAGTPRSRLFVDGVEGFVASAVYENRLHRFFSALTNQLRTHDVTAVFSEEITTDDIDRVDGLMVPIAESAIALQYVRRGAQLHRLISILKMRESDYDPFFREFDITENGFEVQPDQDSAERLLGSSRGGQS